ncbi:MAG: hypothetical protein IJZ29_04435 [Clostridia bacterium]|nr:hypothetical protein [Clostridia bacterium]
MSKSKNSVSINDENINLRDLVKRLKNNGDVIILDENGDSKYIITSVDNQQFLNLTDDEKIEIIAKRILNKHKRAFEVLGQ